MVQRRKKQNQGGEADKNVNNLTGGTEVAEQKRHQIETGQTDQAPVQAADNGENVSNFVNDVHGFLLVKKLFYYVSAYDICATDVFSTERPLCIVRNF